MNRRPVSLAEVASETLAGQRFDPLLREFLDDFYGAETQAKQAAIAEESAFIAAIQDAYLAAVAEHLALRFHLETPGWSEGPRRFLSRPFFAGGLEGLKALLLVESPLAFRRRQIFVSADALSRPRDREATPLAPP
jgi:hypothetical protein